MVLYEYPLFKMSRQLLLFVGQWPYDVGNRKYFIRTVICLVPVISCVTQIYELLIANSKFEQVVHALPLFGFVIVASIKYLTCWIKTGVIEDMLEFIALDYNASRPKHEIEIMKRSTAEGWTLGKSYIVITYGALTAFISTLFIPSILDIITPLDESRSEKMLSEFGYLTNIQGSFYIILNIQCVVAIGVMVTMAADLVYIAIFYYLSGMYRIAGYRLEHMFDDIESMSDRQKKAVIHQRVLNAVTQQLNIIKGTNLVISCYTMSFVAQFFVIVLVIAGALVNARDNLVSKNHVMVCVMSFGMLALYFGVFVNITPGQNLLDRSSELLYKTYSSNWYQAPPKSQKLLLLTMQKAQKPFILSAEGLIDLTYKTCSMIAQTSFSYFTMISSVKK